VTVDASALVSILQAASGAGSLVHLIAAHDAAGMGTASLLECGLVIGARSRGSARSIPATLVGDRGLVPIPLASSTYERHSMSIPGSARGATRRSSTSVTA